MDAFTAHTLTQLSATGLALSPPPKPATTPKSAPEVEAHKAVERPNDNSFSESLSERVDGEDSQYDEKYEEAVVLVARMGQASISMLQRGLRIGYNRAARMIEMMEEKGLVGPSDGVKPREVLVREAYDTEPTRGLATEPIWAKECRRVDNRFRATPHAKALFSGPRIDMSKGLSGAKAYARERSVVVTCSYPFEGEGPGRRYIVIGWDGEIVSTRTVMDVDQDGWDALGDTVRAAIVRDDRNELKGVSGPTTTPDPGNHSAEPTEQGKDIGEPVDDRRRRADLRRHHLQTLEARFSATLPTSDHPQEDAEELVSPILEKLETVLPAGEKERDFAIPSPPETKPIGETARVAFVLGDIFRGERPEDNQAEILADTGNAFSTLDEQHAAFVRELLKRPHWQKTLLETLAAQFRLMPAGALETVNDWSIECFGDMLLIEDHEGYELNPEVTTELT